MTTAHTPHHPPVAARKQDSGLAIASMVLGITSIVSFTGPLLGIPAIIIGVIALKKKAGEKAMSITGIITGAVSTVLGLIALVCLFILFLYIGADDAAQRRYQDEQQPSYYQSEMRPSSEL